MNIQKEDREKILLGIAALAAFSVIAIIVLGFASLVSDVARAPKEAATPLATKVRNQLAAPSAVGVKKFASEAEFTSYLEAARSRGAMYGMGGGTVTMSALAAEDSAVSSKGSVSPNAPRAMAPRVSETNVQVAGIDEPDIVKTDGQVIYFSREQSPFYRMPVLMEKRISAMGVSGIATPDMFVPNQPTEETNVLTAFPPEALAKLGKIDRQGEMLLFGKTLVIFSGQKFYGYDISDRAKPKEAWSATIADGTTIVQARSMGGKLYLVEKTWAGGFGPNPCLFRPMTFGTQPLSIKCTDIYRPIAPSSADSVFTIARIDPALGAAEKNISFVGSGGQSTIYMSQNALYVTYESQGDPVKYLLDFFHEHKGFVPADTVTRLEKLEGYDLGSDAKMVEYQNIIAKMGMGMTGDDRLKWETDRSNKMKAYAAKHARELLLTGVVKVSADTLAIEAQGAVPGRVLNQFSLDEHQGNLRIATTIGEGNWFFDPGQTAVANDVYVLDGKLRQVGALLDLGAGERIYSARFDGDRGYLVTFRQTDPFFVLDLSNPKAPRKAGELKIPGYSSYLHPLGKNLVLGLGRQDANVKLSLFDVTVADSPVEVSNYLIDEYWTAAADNHHAFLADPAHEIFFLPGGKGGYIFSYDATTLTLAKAAKDDSIKRALYLGDYLYVLGTDAVYVYSEKDWEKVKTLSL
jgi:uncharacterized secreted protein with C-terminal beta-propeller domain